MKSLVEHLSLTELILEASTSCQNETSYIGHIVCDEMSRGKLCHLSEVVMALLFSETGETD